MKNLTYHRIIDLVKEIEQANPDISTERLFQFVEYEMATRYGQWIDAGHIAKALEKEYHEGGKV